MAEKTTMIDHFLIYVKNGGVATEVSRLNRFAISKRLGMSASRVRYYMNLPDAPMPDAQMCYDLDEVRKFIDSKTTRFHKGLRPPGAVAPIDLKQEKLQLEIAKLKREEALRSGEVILVRDVLETIEQIIVEVEGIYKSKFEHELPSKYRGKTEVECRELNVKALQEAARTFREGKAKLEKTEALPAPETNKEPKPANQ